MVAKNALLFAALLASSMLFAGNGDWDGQLFINGVLAADGTQVCAYVNGVENSRTTIGAYASGYYLMDVVGSTGDNVTFRVFCDSKYPAKEGAQSWAASPPRHHLNLTIDYDSTVGNASNITSSGTGTLNMTINGTTPGAYYSDVQTVNISSPAGVILSFSFDFSNSSLNLSAINISNGTSGGASYISVSGVNTTGGLSGTKTLVIYGANTTYNAVCVEDVEGATYLSISTNCDGTNEIRVPCNGTASGITCTKSGTTLTVSGLHHSAAMQYSIPAATTTTTTTSTGGNGGGSGGSGASSGSSSKPSTDYVVDIGTANCTVSVARSLSSSSNLSVLTTTLTNNGGSACSLADFTFSDTIPGNFAAMNDINFTPAYSSREGWMAIFAFPSFAPGESKALSYAVSGWVPPSRVNNFTAAALSAKKREAAPAKPETPAKKPSQPQQPPVQPAQTVQPQKPAEKPSAPVTAVQPQQPPSTSATLILAIGILVAIAVVAGAVYFLALKAKK